MIRYTVLWDADVEAQFTDAWVRGDGAIRTTLTEIANWIDQNLSEDPDQKGQLREDLGVRVVALPLSSSIARSELFVSYSRNNVVEKEPSRTSHR